MNHCTYCLKELKKRSQKKFCNTTCANKARGIDKTKTEYERIRIGGILKPLHKVIWERKNGTVAHGFIVHHKNGDKLDNRIENLELMTHKQHCEHHNQKYPKIKRCAICGNVFEPKPSKRKVAQCCSWQCGRKLSVENNPSLHGCCLENLI